MYDGVVSLCERVVYQRSYAGEAPGPQGNSHPFFCPFDVFPTRDGHVAVCASEDHQWPLLCAAMGRPELAGDARFRDAEGRRRHAGAVRALVARWTAAHTAEEIVAAVGARVPVGPVQSAADIEADAGLWARETLVSLEHPGCEAPVTVAGLPIKLSETPGGVRRRAPLLGEHTDEVLGELAAPAAPGGRA
jgi:formyl-CoA transferase